MSASDSFAKSLPPIAMRFEPSEYTRSRFAVRMALSYAGNPIRSAAAVAVIRIALQVAFVAAIRLEILAAALTVSAVPQR